MTTREAAAPLVLELDGRAVSVPNPDKVLFPAIGFTKRELVAYYLAVAAALLRHLASHAVTLARFPDGVDAPGWYQTNCPAGAPDWVGIAEVAGARGQTLRYCRLESAAALAWAAGQAALELHPLLGAVDAPGVARTLVLDLDPRSPAGLAACARVALRLRERLAAAGLAAFPKTSGGRGLHLHVPLAGAPGFDRTRAFARALAMALARADPAGVTERVALQERAGKVLVDWRQNSAARSLIAPYSVRAATLPLVATPLRWEEVEEAAAAPEPAPGLGPLRFGPNDVLERLRTHGDLLAPALGPGPSEELASVQLHLATGEVLDLCHVMGLAPCFVALAVRESPSVDARMRTELVPYSLITRVTIRPVRGAAGHVGFDVSRAPELLSHEGSPEDTLRCAAALGPEHTDRHPSRS